MCICAIKFEFTIEYFITTYFIINRANRFIDVNWRIKIYRIGIEDVKQILQASPSRGQQYKIISIAIAKNVDNFATKIAANIPKLSKCCKE